MKHTVCRLALVLIVAQLAVVLVSWLLSATVSEHVHTLLSGEGVRWFVGGFSRLLLHPLLSWLLLGAMAAGCVRRSGIAECMQQHADYRQRMALSFVAVLAVVSMVAVGLLAFMPHAVLLSATGGLWPSPFSDALVPLAALVAVGLSTVYGFMTGRFGRASDVFLSLTTGLSDSAPLLLLYVLAVPLYESLCFVFGF